MLVLAMLVVIAVLVGCDQAPKSKALIVVNASVSTDIENIQIRQYVTGERTLQVYNALGSGEVIAPGAEKTFYIAPYSFSETGIANGWCNLDINLGVSGSIFAAFTFNPDSDEAITATYDGSTVSLSGSGSYFEID
jgi:hypothetical protein